jgi:hypothetical protein
MFSGLDRKQVVERRQRSVAWAWVKARSTMKDQTKTTHAKLTSSVLLSSETQPGQEISNWRDSLAALSHRSLARQICDQFYDLSILAAWRERSADLAAAERALSTALPAFDESRANPANSGLGNAQQPVRKSLMTTSVLPDRDPQRTAVLIQLRSKAA